MDVIKIYLSPQVSDIENYQYSFDNDVVTVVENDVEDVFDFSGLPDGKLELCDVFGNETIETVLDVNPIISAEREEGILYLKLLNRIGENATEEERFPEWIDAKDYVFKENENFKEVDNGEVELEESEGN